MDADATGVDTSQLSPHRSVLHCSFFLDSRPFAVPVLQVKEVHVPTSITPIPGAPLVVLGYVNLRGHLHVVLDPHLWLTGHRHTAHGDGHLIVFKAQVGVDFAIQVDRLGDIVAIRPEQIDVPQQADRGTPSIPGGGDRLIVGHAKLENSLLALVEPAELYRLCWLDS